MRLGMLVVLAWGFYSPIAAAQDRTLSFHRSTLSLGVGVGGQTAYGPGWREHAAWATEIALRWDRTFGWSERPSTTPPREVEACPEFAGRELGELDCGPTPEPRLMYGRRNGVYAGFEVSVSGAWPQQLVMGADGMSRPSEVTRLGVAALGLVGWTYRLAPLLAVQVGARGGVRLLTREQSEPHGPVFAPVHVFGESEVFLVSPGIGSVGIIAGVGGWEGEVFVTGQVALRWAAPAWDGGYAVSPSPPP